MVDYQSCLLKPDNPDLMYNHDCLSTYLNKIKKTSLSHCTVMIGYQSCLLKPDIACLMCSHDRLWTNSFKSQLWSVQAVEALNLFMTGCYGPVCFTSLDCCATFLLTQHWHHVPWNTVLRYTPTDDCC